MKPRVTACLERMFLVALWLGFLSAAGYSYAAGLVEAGVFSRVMGTVTAVHGGSDDVEAHPAEQGAPVYAGDLIRTAERSKAKLLMADDTILTLGQSAELTIDEYTFRPDEAVRSSVVSLGAGSLRSMISKTFDGTGSKFEVHTRTAVAGARGTTNIVSVIGPDMTLVVGMDGETVVGNIDPSVAGEVLVGPGYGTYVEMGKPPTEPFIVPDGLLGPIEEDTYIGRAPLSGPGEDAEPGEDEDALPPATAPVTPVQPADEDPRGGDGEGYYNYY